MNICPKRKSVLDHQSHCLVLGGPGSGKTTLALLKAGTWIDRSPAAGECALFLSFSRAAVARIQESTTGNISPAASSLLSIQTFHSFFWQILQAYGYLLGAPRRLSIIPAHEEKALRDGIDRDSPAWNDWEKVRVNLFRTEGRVCFDLFAPLAAELLSRCATVRDRIASRYPLILVDEAQDTGDEQWKSLHLLSKKSQLVCLADPDQMIYDFLPGVGPKRLDDIREALTPLEIDLGGENNRSPTTEIAAFARDILKGTVRGSAYIGVSRYRFKSSVEERDKAIRCSVGIISKLVREQTGTMPESVAILSSYGSGVAVISAALQKGKPIPHQVLFDEAFALLASRVSAFLLEPKDPSLETQDVATVLELAGEALRSKGTKTALEESRKYKLYANRCRADKVPTFKPVAAATELVKQSREGVFTGDPRRDWSTVKQYLRDSANEIFREIAYQLDYLVAFARGRRIAESLSDLWLQHGTYLDASGAIDNALAQDQLLSGGDEVKGIHVMNMHKCKGKQFDGVVIYRQEHHSPFVWRNEKAPHPGSRRLLHMAITRAKYHVLFLDDVFSKCPILDPHKL
jgi:DNA helicase-2/ATP-dependent DNA helicase PcrA